jgi:hypothetical protein
MSDVIELMGESFGRPLLVETLSQKSFTTDEVAEVLEIPKQRIKDLIGFRFQFVSDPPTGSIIGQSGRKYCPLDIYGLGLFNALDRVFKAEGRHALIIEFAALTFGDAVSLQEGRDRRIEFAAERERALRKPRTKEIADKQLWQMHQARRLELRQSIFNAMPLWWSRDEHRHFVLFVGRNRQMYQLILVSRFN